MRRMITLGLVASVLAAALAMTAQAASWPAEVLKPSVEVHGQADFSSPVVAKLAHKTHLVISDQQGLWFRVTLADGTSGYLRVNEVRIAETKKPGDSALDILMTGRSGSGRVTETAGVRGLDESDLQAASFNAAELQKMEGNRVAADVAEQYARQQGWHAISIPWANEADGKNTASSGHGLGQALAKTRGLLKSLGGKLQELGEAGEAAAPASDQDEAQEELALGPMIAGRVLGARPLWANAQAQHRINVIGRWLASQTSRPNLPWTFGVIDTPEINAFAAPGGYILMTRGLYELADGDQELAAALGHEITHVVQRDQYHVIRKQQMMSAAKNIASSEIQTGGGKAASLARDYVEKNGAAILMTSLDRSAEYRADENAELYLARAGMEPLSLYAILQKMLAVGTTTGGLAQLYKTHPSLDDRLGRLDQFDASKLRAGKARG